MNRLLSPVDQRFCHLQSYPQVPRTSSLRVNRELNTLGSGAQPSKSELSDVNNNSSQSTTLTDDKQKKLIIRGMMIDTNGQDLAKRVRRMVMDWKDSTVNGNFIVKVDRETVDGATVIVVTTRSANHTELLIRAAAKHVVKGTGIVWKHYPSVKSPTGTERKLTTATNAHPDRMFVVTGLKSRTTDDVLDLVRQIMTSLSHNVLRAEDIVDVSRDHKWKSRDGAAMLFVTAVDAHKKRLALDLARSSGHCRLPAGVELKDYNGFKH